MSDQERAPDAAADPTPAPPPSRDALRSRRKRLVRARTLSGLRFVKRDLTLGRLIYPEDIGPLPPTRGHCADLPRPCPHVRCRWHLYLDVHPRTGSLKLNFPDIEPEDMTESCALDVADRGGVPHGEVGAILNLTRERVRQVEVRAMSKVMATDPGLVEHLERQVRRRLPVLPPAPPPPPAPRPTVAELLDQGGTVDNFEAATGLPRDDVKRALLALWDLGEAQVVDGRWSRWQGEE